MPKQNLYNNHKEKKIHMQMSRDQKIKLSWKKIYI